MSAAIVTREPTSDQRPPVVTRRRTLARRTRIVAGLVAALGLVFVGLALMLRASGGTELDLMVTHTVQRIDDPTFTMLMLAVSAPGYAPWTWLCLGSASLLLLLAGLWREALFILATEGAGMLTASVKLLVERPRPTAEMVRVASALVDYSYPSGHVVGYVTLFGFLWFVVYVRFKRSWRRTLALAVLGSLIGLIGLSRVHLGYHWASDVLGGYALGTAYLLLLIEVYRFVALRRAGPDQSPTIAYEGRVA